VGGVVVGYTDGACLAAVEYLQHGTPGGEAAQALVAGGDALTTVEK